MSYPPVKFKFCKPFSRLARSFKRAQKEVPIVVELFIAISILCILLIADILWLGATHRQELKIIKESHLHDVDKFRKQFDAQIHQVDEQHISKEKDNIEEHGKDVDRMKVRHQQELERKIGSIQKELNGLMSLSKTYWEQHAFNHDKNSNKDLNS